MLWERNSERIKIYQRQCTIVANWGSIDLIHSFIHRKNTNLIISMEHPVFDSWIIQRMKCESMPSTNAEIAPITVAVVNQTALRAWGSLGHITCRRGHGPRFKQGCCSASIIGMCEKLVLFDKKKHLF